MFACKASFKAHSYRVCRAAVPYNGHYYQIAPTRVSFADAIRQASQLSYNGHLWYLAAVSRTNSIIVKVLGARNVWLASKDIQQEGVWLITAGPDITAPTPVDLWAFGKPFGIGENCAISTTGEGLSKTNCDETCFCVIEFACQASNVTVCACTKRLDM